MDQESRWYSMLKGLDQNKNLPSKTIIHKMWIFCRFFNPSLRFLVYLLTHEHVLKLKGQRVLCTNAVFLYTLPPFLQDFHQFCQHLSLEQVEAAFSKFDISGDEELDYREFCTMMNAKKSVITGTTSTVNISAI